MSDVIEMPKSREMRRDEYVAERSAQLAAMSHGDLSRLAAYLEFVAKEAQEFISKMA